VIRLRATRRAPEHKRDALVIECGAETRVLDCWRQGILPHELFHAAVESVFPWRGFVRLVAQGRDPASIGARDALPETLWAEALTNAIQAQQAGLIGPSDGELREYLATIHAGALPPIAPAELELVRARIRDWSARWAALRAGENLEITLEAR
jgi:hypothetical protein